MGTGRHAAGRGWAPERVDARAGGSWLCWTLGTMWLCIATAVVVRLLTGSEGWGALALLGSAVVAHALLPDAPPHRR